MSPPLFVYGTLRRGGSNDIARLVPRATCAGTARVRGRLYAVGWYPHLLLDASGGWVVGELYDVPADAWPVLDALEEVVTPDRPNGAYFRREAIVERTDAAPGASAVNAVRAILYEGNAAVLPVDVPISGGDWIRFAMDENGSRPG
jgi:gamma-glutamylcyclotransferase (GGCT)/AIG2-like uncharacterized protein YtfP